MTCAGSAYSDPCARRRLRCEVTLMNLTDKIVLVTGANRGLGRALVDASLQDGARRVYAAARDLESVRALFASAPSRVVPIQLDITNELSLAEGARRASDVAVLFNNAGVLASRSALHSSAAEIAQDFATNCFGMLAATKAFLPALERAGATGGAAVVNVLSVVSLANMPALGAYSASKAAASSLTQALRAELGARGVRVHGVFAGAMDTDMVRSVSMPKASPAEVARAILSGIEQGKEDIFPDAMSQGAFATWRKDPKELERQLASMSG